MTRRSKTPYTDALWQDLGDQIDAERCNGAIEAKLAQGLLTRKAEQYLGFELIRGKATPDKTRRVKVRRIVEARMRQVPLRGRGEIPNREALSDARKIMSDSKRLERLQGLDDVNVARHHASTPMGSIATPDGVVLPFHGEAGKQRTESCKGSPDAFSFAERDAIRRAKNPDAPWFNPARNEISHWAGASKASASGGTERRLASSEDLVDVARRCSNKTQARHAAAMLKAAPVNRTSIQSAMLAAMSQGLDRAAKKRTRKAFLDALR